MKLIPFRSLLLLLASFFPVVLLQAQPAPPGQPGQVQYSPPANTVQGNQPLATSYVITMIAPANLTGPTTVTLGSSILAKPSTGVTDAQALSFISLSPSVVTFSGPNASATITVSVVVPLGNFAGNYAYKILPAGWPTNVGEIDDAGATVNALVSPPLSADNTPPAVTLLTPAPGTVYTYQPATGQPVTVPVSFSASVGTNGSPVTTMLASISAGGVTMPVLVTGTVLPALAPTASGPFQLTTPGNYTVTVAAGNGNGTSFASSNISVVVVAPPPTITAASPAANSTFSYVVGSAGASVPLSFTATSIYGNITTLGATLDGAPVTLNASGVGTALAASGSASLLVATAGSHSLVLTAANDYGAATPVTIPFKVASTSPTPTVTILTPANGATFTRVAGDPATVVSYTFQGGSPSSTVKSVKVTLDGSTITPTLTGLNTAAVSGAGSMSFSAGAAHTLTVTLTNGSGVTASASTSFTVTQTQPKPNETLCWLPPTSLNKTIQGGSVAPIDFTLTWKNNFVRDTAVLIAVYEVYRNGSTSTPVIYPYGSNSNANPPDYAINGQQYQLNFPTASGTHSYQVEVYTGKPGALQLLGSTEIDTSSRDCGNNNGCNNGNNGGYGNGRDCDNDYNNGRDCDDDDDYDRDYDRRGDCNDGHH